MHYTPDSSLIEPRFRESIDLFVSHGYLPGNFLAAVMANDLKESIARADEAALANLPHIVAYLYNEVPASAWGSYATLAAWFGAIEARRATA